MLTYNKRFRANALPEAVFKYFSKSIAVSLLSKPPYHARVHGRDDLVEIFLPALWSDKRSLKSAVLP